LLRDTGRPNRSLVPGIVYVLVLQCCSCDWGEMCPISVETPPASKRSKGLCQQEQHIDLGEEATAHLVPTWCPLCRLNTNRKAHHAPDHTAGFVSTSTHVARNRGGCDHGLQRFRIAQYVLIPTGITTVWCVCVRTAHVRTPLLAT